VTHLQRLEWMALWAAQNGLRLTLEGECGFGRECVGVLANECYPDYVWYDKNYDRIDNNGEVWIPPNAYHKAEVVAVLGRGEVAETRLYEWLLWFNNNGFKLETGDADMDPALGVMGVLLGKHRYQRMVRARVLPTELLEGG
jgi:hypothetical protein